jgi:branched-chain amino acid transport system substrate-binding protein
MARESIAELIAKLHNGTIDRRGFVQRAGIAGLSATLIGQVLRAAPVGAQDATPGATPGGEASSTTIGNASIPRVTDTSKGTIKLYSSWPLTGGMATVGGDAVAVLKMAVEDFGAAAGGFKLEYEPLDDGVAANNGGWEAATESNNADKVIGDPDAVVYMGTYNSGAAKISIPKLNAAVPPLAMISYANTATGLTKKIDGVTDQGEPDIYYPSGKRNYCRICPSDDIQGGAAAKWSYGERNRRKAYVVHDNSYYGKGVAAVFRDQFKAAGGEILGFDGFDPKASDYQALATGIANTGPDVIMSGATVENNPALVLQAIRGVLSVDDCDFIGSDGQNNTTFVSAAGDAAEGAYLTFGGFTPDKLLEVGGPGGDYVSRAQKLLGHMPDAYAVYAYESAVVVFQALDKVGEKDRQKVLDALLGTKDFKSLLGHTWSFTDTGDTDAAIIGLSQVIKGNITFQKPITS